MGMGLGAVVARACKLDTARHCGKRQLTWKELQSLQHIFAAMVYVLEQHIMSLLPACLEMLFLRLSSPFMSCSVPQAKPPDILFSSVE